MQVKVQTRTLYSFLRTSKLMTSKARLDSDLVGPSYTKFIATISSQWFLSTCTSVRKILTL